MTPNGVGVSAPFPLIYTTRPRATEVDVAVQALNRMLELGRPSYARIA